MPKLNIETANSLTFKSESANALKAFDASFLTLNQAYSRRLQIERDAFGVGFDADAFWADHTIRDQVIESTYRRPAKKSDGTPKLRKGQPVFEVVKFNKRDVQNAASMIRMGVRGKAAKDKLVQAHGTIEAAVASADKLGSVLGMVRRLALAGLCPDNKSASTAKEAAIKAYSGETPSASARKTLIASLYGQPVTSAQVKQLGEALTQFGEDMRLARKATTDSRPFVAPPALTFAGVFGILTTIKAHKEKKARASRTTRSKATETLPVEVAQQVSDDLAQVVNS